MANGSILLTGGAGYIGSHVLRQLAESGEQVVVLDNLGRGFRQAVTAGTLVVGDVGDYALVSRLLKEHAVDTVMHFAAHTIVPESVADPLKYYGNNTCATRSLLQACLEQSVRRFVFSSTASVYGIPEGGYADEDTPTAPINAYGSSKLMSEWMLRDAAAASGLRYVALRYFNVAGSDPQGRIGQATRGATLLVKVACEAMVGKRPYVSVYGSDYPTPDGTGVRDYIHVVDLAEAHALALEHIVANDVSITVNLGTGEGTSVLQLVNAFETATGRKIPLVIAPRRPGDVSSYYANPALAEATFGWKAERNVEDMCRDSWRWQAARAGINDV